MKINYFEYFLVKCGGGDINILEEQNIQPDINKQIGIGGAVLLTGILAAITFGYAMSWVFSDLRICFFLGAIWGLMIFNLDRLIVSGSIKTSRNGLSFYSSTFFRMFLAVGIAFTISVPIELKLFESKLAKETARIEINNSKRLKELKEEQIKTFENAHKEVAGEGKTKRIGNGEVTKFLMNASIEKDKQVKIEQQEIENKIVQNANNLGLLERYKALISLKRDPDVNSIVNGITILFILVELIPILIKLFSTDAVYDDKIRVKIREEQQKMNIAKIVLDRDNENEEVKEDDGITIEKMGKIEKIVREKIVSLGVGLLVALLVYPFVKDLSYTTTTGIFVWLLYKPILNSILSNED
jgi:hypothetical protein